MEAALSILRNSLEKVHRWRCQHGAVRTASSTETHNMAIPGGSDVALRTDEELACEPSIVTPLLRSLLASGPPPGPRQFRRDDGYAMAMALMFVIVVSVLGSGLLALSTFEGQQCQGMWASRQAFYLAEAGAQLAQAQLAATDDSWDSVFSMGEVLHDGVSFAGGTYTVTIDAVQPDEVTLTASGTRPYGSSMHRTRTIELVVQR